MRIAVIGTGIGGLAAAWWLGRDHEVTVFEKLPALGMAAHSVTVGEGERSVRVDVPLRVVYPGYYPNLLALYRGAGIATEPVDYASSFSRLGGETYFRYRNLRLFGRSWPTIWGRQALGRTSRAITRDLARFYLRAGRELRSERLRHESLGEYLDRAGYSHAFSEEFLLPAFAGIGTCSLESVRAYPASVIVEYLSRGVLLEGVRRTVRDASFVVERLASRVRRTHCGVSIDAVERDASGVLVTTSGGRAERFDHAVVAAQANQALGFLKDAGAEERELLGSFRYEKSRVIVHTDPGLAPRDRRSWASVNFLLDPDADRPMATIFLNAVWPVEVAQPVFQTWNPLREPDPRSVLAEASFERPIVDASSVDGLAALERLHAEPDRRVWFCGSYASPGIPLLESAATSARAVAERIGAGDTR